MKCQVYWSILICSLIVLLAAASPSAAERPVVNLMIEADMPSTATEDQETIAESYLFNIYTSIKEKGLTATIFSTQDFVYSHARLRLTDIGRTSSFELAMSGNHSDEKLSRLDFETQKALLKTSKSYVEGCRVCGEMKILATGFMPQSFDQNEETYKALDDLGVSYDAGFQAGILYAPGHEKDVWPYKVPNHKFYAVPVSSIDHSGKKMALVDGYAKDMGLSSSQWRDILMAKLDEAQDKDEPVVVSLSTSISGTGNYLVALEEFLDYALTKDAKFLTSMDLVNMSRSEDEVPATAATSADSKTNISANASIVEEGSSGCPTCDAKKKASANPIVPQNETISIVMEVGGNSTEKAIDWIEA